MRVVPLETASLPPGDEARRRGARLAEPLLVNRSLLPSVVVDEVLVQKSEPHVAERRSRFRRVVVGAVGTCGAICALAVVVSLVQALGEPEARASTTRLAVNVATTEPVTRTALPPEPSDAREGAARRPPAAADAPGDVVHERGRAREEGAVKARSPTAGLLPAPRKHGARR